MVARWVHVPKVACSSHAPATIFYKMGVRVHRKVSSKGFHLFFLDSKAGKFVLLEPKVKTQPGQLLTVGQTHKAPAGDKRSVKGYQRVYGAVHGNNAWVPVEWIEKYTVEATPDEMHSDSAVKTFLIIDQPNMKIVKAENQNDAGSEKAASIIETASKAISTVVDTAKDVTGGLAKNTKEGVTEPVKKQTLTVEVPGIFKATPLIGLAVGIGYCAYKKEKDWKQYALFGLAGFGIGSAPLAVYSFLPKKDAAK